MRREKMMIPKNGMKRRFVGRLLNKAYSAKRSHAWWANFATRFCDPILKKLGDEGRMALSEAHVNAFAPLTTEQRNAYILALLDVVKGLNVSQATALIEEAKGWLAQVSTIDAAEYLKLTQALEASRGE